MGLLAVLHPVNCLNKIYRGRVGAVPLSVMTFSFSVGVALNGFEFLENLGTEATGAQLSRVASRCADRVSLELAYNLGESLSIWIFSLDYVFLATGFAVSSFFSFRYALINSWHGVVGGVCALLCMASFALEIAQVADASVFSAFGAVNLFLMGLAFPVWLAWLAWILGSDNFQLSNNQSQQAAQPALVAPPTL